MAYFPVRRTVFDSSKNFLVLPALLLAGAALLAGCHRAVTDPKDPKFIVAEKGDWQITRAQLDAEITNFLQQNQMTPEQVGTANMPKLETKMLDNLVLKKLILAKAATLQLKDVDKTEAAELEAIKGRIPPGQDLDQQLKKVGLTLDELKRRIHEKVLIVKVLQTEAFLNNEPTDQEINDIYLKNQDKFTVPLKVRASRILIMVGDKDSPADKAAKKKAIDKARARVVHGEDFSKVAMEVSDDKYSAPRGGDIDFFQRGVNEPGFDEVAFNTKAGALSPVFTTPLGYQFLKVTAVQPAGVVPIADSRAFITDKLRQMKMQQEEQEYSRKLLAEGGVTFHLVRVDLTPTPAPTPAKATSPQ